MRLLEPDLGEVLDRLTILEMKIEAAGRYGKPSEGFEQEKKELEMYLNQKIQGYRNYLGSAGAWASFEDSHRQLAVANAHLWRLEDELRVFRKQVKESGSLEQVAHEIASIALQIANMNDLRSEYVRKINAICGVQQMEKLYVQ